MAVFNLENIADGDKVIPYESVSRDRVMAWRFHTYPSAGTFDVTVRPQGEDKFLPVDGGSGLDAAGSGCITIGFPVAEVKISFTGLTGSPRFMTLTFTELSS